MVSFDELVQLDLKRLTAALRPPEPAVVSLERGQWLALIETLATRMIEEGGRLGTADWPAVSAAYSSILRAAEEAGAITVEEGVIRRLNLSAALLAEIAPNAAAEILNPGESVSLLLRTLPLSVEEARSLAPRWRELDVAQIRRLRLAKNLLRPMLMINESLRDVRISAWEQVFPLLP